MSMPKRYFAGMTRECPKCAQTYVITEHMSERNKYVCAHCERIRTAFANKNKEKKRARERLWSARNGAYMVEKMRRQRARYPLKYAARQAVQRAIEKGILVRMPCAECGASKAQGHHEDYTKPLDVVWLCQTHHTARHAVLKAAARAYLAKDTPA